MIIFTIALIYRLVFAFVYSDGTVSGDSPRYWYAGSEIASGNWFPMDYMGRAPFMVFPPVVPMLVALSISLFGPHYWPYFVMIIVISSFIPVLMYKLGSTFFSRAIGLIIMIISLIDVNYNRFNTQIMKEPLLLLLVPLTLYFLFRFVFKGSKKLHLVLSAIAFSVLIHTDERFIIYTPFILFIILIFGTKFKSNIQSSILWFLILGLTMIPWLVRNYYQFNDFVILSSRTTPLTSKLWGKDLEKMPFSSEENLNKRIHGLSEKAYEIGKIYGNQPRLHGRYEKYYRAFFHFWKPAYFKLDYIHYGFYPVKWSIGHNLNGVLFYGIFLPFYIMGFAWAVIKRNGMCITVGFIPIIHSLFHTLIVWPLERYRLPVNFCIILIALWFINDIRAKWAAYDWRK